jgi:hypothetical protein
MSVVGSLDERGNVLSGRARVLQLRTVAGTGEGNDVQGWQRIGRCMKTYGVFSHCGVLVVIKR